MLSSPSGFRVLPFAISPLGPYVLSVPSRSLFRLSQLLALFPLMLVQFVIHVSRSLSPLLCSFLDRCRLLR
ncbi:hypothetical protein OH77DRAFT_1419799 [Trametes cingulata]|nr:hypothetical protein OH77DRAFT_1419799 [Trametes cingulata]